MLEDGRCLLGHELLFLSLSLQFSIWVITVCPHSTLRSFFFFFKKTLKTRLSCRRGLLLLCVCAVSKLLIFPQFEFLSHSSSVINLVLAEQLLNRSASMLLQFTNMFNSDLLWVVCLFGHCPFFKFRKVCHLFCVSLCCWHLFVFCLAPLLPLHPCFLLA